MALIYGGSIAAELLSLQALLSPLSSIHRFYNHRGKFSCSPVSQCTPWQKWTSPPSPESRTQARMERLLSRPHFLASILQSDPILPTDPPPGFGLVINPPGAASFPTQNPVSTPEILDEKLQVLLHQLTCNIAPLLTCTVASEIAPNTWSDHAPITLDIAMSTSAPRTCHWHFNDLLLQSSATKDKLAKGLTEYFQLNGGSVQEVSMLWEAHKAHKAFFCGLCISEGSCLKREANSQLRASERLLLCSPTVSHLCEVTSLRNQLKGLAMGKTAKFLMWAKQNFYEFSKKTA